MTAGPIGVVGLGLIGGSLALAVRARRAGQPVVGFDPDPRVRERALARGAVSRLAAGYAGLAGCRLVVVAAPIPALGEVFAGLVEAGVNGVVTDVASVKGPVLELAAAAGLDLVGGHPMCGREVSGIDSATPDLFEGATWFMTGEHPAVRELVELVGARPSLIDPDRHDRWVARTSHLAFTMSAAYQLAVAAGEDWPAVLEAAGPGFRDMTRLAAGDPELHTAIAGLNRRHLLREVEAAIDRLQALHAALAAGDRPFAELLAEARKARQRLAGGGRG